MVGPRFPEAWDLQDHADEMSRQTYPNDYYVLDIWRHFWIGKLRRARLGWAMLIGKETKQKNKSYQMTPLESDIKSHQWT